MDPQTASVELMEKFWKDWLTSVGKMQAQAVAATGRMAQDAAEIENGAGHAMPPGMPLMTPDAARQFHAAFLDSLSKYCEEYMRSPQFLTVMKTAMDNALTFRQQVNDFLGSAVAKGFQPPVGMPPDQAVIVDAIRETERKLRDHIEVLSDRVEQLESRIEASRKPAPARRAAARKSEE